MIPRPDGFTYQQFYFKPKVLLLSFWGALHWHYDTYFPNPVEKKKFWRNWKRKSLTNESFATFVATSCQREWMTSTPLQSAESANRNKTWLQTAKSKCKLKDSFMKSKVVSSSFYVSNKVLVQNLCYCQTRVEALSIWGALHWQLWALTLWLWL